MNVTAGLAAAALGLIVVSLTLPWLTINIFGQFTITPIDLIREGVSGPESGQAEPFSQESPDFSNVGSAYPDTSAAFGISIILYPVSMAVMAASLGMRGHRKELTMIAGIAAVVSAVAWIYAVESLKTHVAANAQGAGAFGQLASAIITSAVSTGAGPYVVMAGGAIALACYFVKPVAKAPTIEK